MQIIGIFLEDADIKIRKKLQEGTWYPFGKFSDCRDIFINDQKYQKILKEVKENQEFINELYKLDNLKSSPKINLNCIVGKNGAGKSSLIALEYRIINNFSCKIKFCLQHYNQDYHPTWAYGFNAELYYELDDKLFCIKITNNNISNNSEFFQKQKEYEPNRVQFISKENDSINSLFEVLEAARNNINLTDRQIHNSFLNKEQKLLSELSNTIFYSISTNYSLYSNSVVKDSFTEQEESWLNNLFHKNDGYFTPIVLVPYKEKGTVIDTKKELSLANERVSTLSILTYAENNKTTFIDSFFPTKIAYSLINSTEYEKKIHKKLDGILDSIDYNSIGIDTREEIEIRIELEDDIKNIWNELLFSEEKNKKYIDMIKCNQKSDRINFDELKQNTLTYLMYKTIKVCIYYDFYKNLFLGSDIVYNYYSDKNKFTEIIKKLVNEFIEKNNVNFMNLKIKQCITFLDNLNIYVNDNLFVEQEDCYILGIVSFINYFCSNNKMLNYDYIFKNLLPSFFYKELYFSTRNNEKKLERTLSSLSSGESQLFNTISYAIYHMKNASCIQNDKQRIKYKNINLVFDEAELYYHPEYQRTFISDLLGILKRSNLRNKITSINITLITHSPFMLSDIPTTNITYLNGGHIDDTIINETLAANIYDLLKNQFFMESTYGENSKKIIQNFINEYHLYIKTGKISNRMSFYKKFIRNIGESYLRSLLDNMYLKMEGKDFKERLRDEYEKQINDYQQKIRALENETN